MPAQAMHSRGYYVFTMSHYLSCCPDDPCQHGLVSGAGKSIIHMQRRHHITAQNLWLSNFYSDAINKNVIITVYQWSIPAQNGYRQLIIVKIKLTC